MEFIKFCPSKEYKIENSFVFKKCTTCLIFKQLELFTKDKYSKDKRTNNCTECRNKIPQDNNKNRETYKLIGKIKKSIYYQENKNLIHKQRLERIKQNPDLILKDRIRRSIRKQRLKINTIKICKTNKIIGCNKKQLFEHLKKTFEFNYKITYKDKYFNDLHVDHIIPLSSAKTSEELIKLSHYSNLQFLHKDHNMKKKNRLNYIIPKYPLENN